MKVCVKLFLLVVFFFPPECVLTSGRELFGVDDFGGVLLACAEFDAAAHHGEGSPGKDKTGGRGRGRSLRRRRRSRLRSRLVSVVSRRSGWPLSHPDVPSAFTRNLTWICDVQILATRETTNWHLGRLWCALTSIENEQIQCFLKLSLFNLHWLLNDWQLLLTVPTV